MKKVNIFILSLVLIFSITTSSATAGGIIIKKYKGYVYRVDGTEVVDRKKHPYWSVPSYITITDYKGSKKSITIPQKIKTANKIERHKKKKLFVPKKLRKAKVEAVEGYGNLERIHVPAGVVLRNLSTAKKLKRITVSKKHKLYSVTNKLLYNKKKTVLISAVCDKKSPQIAKTTKVIDSEAFKEAEFSEFVLPSRVKRIEMRAFENAKNLRKIVWNDKIKEINTEAFMGCTALEDVSIPDSVISLGFYAFKNCTNLKSISFGKGITYLPGGIFDGCVKLKELSLPITIRKLGKDSINDEVEKLYVYNSRCEFVYFEDVKYRCSVSENVTIYGYKGSTAEEYAKKNGNKFVALD